MLRQTRWTILLSLNAVAIIIAGILIANALDLNAGVDFRVVSEYTDVTDEESPISELIDSVVAEQAAIIEETKRSSYTGGGYSGYSGGHGLVRDGKLWAIQSMTIYQSADVDICTDTDDVSDMYWQSDNQTVISGFYSGARTWLGYNTSNCVFPIITGTGTTTITAGTYDGRRRDTLTVTVVAVPAEQWKREVLNLVNRERTARGLGSLSWGSTCEGAANVRAGEIMTRYDHTRPDGSDWSTACPIPNTGGVSGENLAMGNAAVSPETVVALWMNSETHRNNILNPNFTKLAVGLVFDPNTAYKTYWSQVFSNF